MEKINYPTKRYPKLNDTWIMNELQKTLTVTKISSPDAMVVVVRNLFTVLDYEKEHFISASVNTQNTIKSVDLISTGSLNANVVHPREVFYAAIANRAAGIITSHNHPGGNVTPSQNDIDIVKKLTEAGKIIGIGHFDHIIYGGEKWFSFKEQNLI